MDSLLQGNLTQSGLIPIYKPRGISSKDVSRVLSRKYKSLKLGHVGTLDPDADGVLPILVNRCTKLQDYLLDLEKEYSFDLELGVSSDTMDATGNIVERQPFDHIQKSDIEGLIPKFLGSQLQTPPLYSAVKYKGKELYKYARSGSSDEEIPLEDLSRRVQIYQIDLHEFAPPKVHLSVRCSKGTYVRVLGTDMAKALGTVARLTRITRLKSAGIRMDQCLDIDQINFEETSLHELMIPMENLSIGLPRWEPSDKVLLRRIMNGQRVVLDPPFDLPVSEGALDHVALYDKECGLLGVVGVEPLVGRGIKLYLKRGL